MQKLPESILIDETDFVVKKPDRLKARSRQSVVAQNLKSGIDQIDMCDLGGRKIWHTLNNN